MKEGLKYFFALLRSTIYGTKLSMEERAVFVSELILDLVKISSEHDVVHLLILGLKQNELILNEHGGNIEEHIFKAVYRYEWLRYDYENLC